MKQQGASYENLRTTDGERLAFSVVDGVLFNVGPFLLKVWPSSCEDSLME
jgi:hypothetical protein